MNVFFEVNELCSMEDTMFLGTQDGIEFHGEVVLKWIVGSKSMVGSGGGGK